MLTKIAEATEMELPEPMIKYNQEKMFEEFAQNLMYQGINIDQYLALMGTTKEQMLEQIKPDAIKRIKNGLILEAVVDAENITATDEEYDEELKTMAESYQMEIDKLKELIGDNEKDSIKKDIAVKKALELLSDNCKEV